LPQLLLSGSSFGNNNKVSKIPKVSYAYSLLTIIKPTNQANYTNHKKLQNMQTLQNIAINLTHSQGPQDTAGLNFMMLECMELGHTKVYAKCTATKIHWHTLPVCIVADSAK